MSILILTRDEEAELPGCLASLDGFGEVVVVDSCSTDATPRIAEEASARIVTRAFTHWSDHQNWIMENVAFEYPWVFYMDADERMTPALKDELTRIAGSDEPAHSAWFVARDNLLFGRVLRHAMSDGFVMRFFQPPNIRFERRVNPQPRLLDGSAPGYLRERLVHRHFCRGFTQWFEKHNRYATWEAQEWIEAEERTAVSWRGVVSADRHRRNQALKRLSFALPGRPLLKFLQLYVLKRGFLDGAPGFHCGVLMAVFEYMIGLKVREMKRRRAGLPI